MRFAEVILALSEGKPVRRTSWDEDYFVYYGVHYGQLIEQYLSDDYGKTCVFSPFDMFDFSTCVEVNPVRLCQTQPLTLAFYVVCHRD